MRTGEPVRRSLWSDGQITVRVRGLDFGTGRTIRISRPFAVIGRDPKADLRINDQAVEDRHVFLLLDDQGIFGVDLRSRQGTKFAGELADSARLSVGDLIEVAGRRIELTQLRIRGSVVAPALSDDDLLAEVGPDRRAELVLEPIGAPGPPWTLGSALAFVGRGDACAIRIEDDSVAETHVALLRTASDAYVINLFGGTTLVNDRPIDQASRLIDEDVLSIGRSRFLVRVRKALSQPRTEIVETTRRSDQIKISELENIWSRGKREICLMSPIEPIPVDRTTLPATPSDESAAWLLDRIIGLESSPPSTWDNLMSRISLILRTRSTPKPSTNGPP